MPFVSRSRGLELSAAVTLVFVVIALFAPAIAPHEVNEVVGKAWEGPSQAAPFGTDMIGRDVMSRLIWATRTTLLLAGAATAISAIVGIGMGLMAAMRGGWVDSLLSRFIDLVMALPPLILSLFLIALLPRQSVWLVLIVALVEMPRIFRLARLLAAEIATRDFVDFARLRGERALWVARYEILPNCWRTLLAEIALRFCFAVLMLSTVSFIGLGIQPPDIDWGGMIRENKDGMLFGAAAVLFPGAAIALLSLSIGVLAEGFARRGSRDA